MVLLPECSFAVTPMHVYVWCSAGCAAPPVYRTCMCHGVVEAAWSEEGASNHMRRPTARRFLHLKNIIEVVYQVAPSIDEWQALHSFGFAPQCSSKMLKLVRWIPPLHDFSLNVDGACKGNPGDCGGGGCIQDSQGNVHLAFAHFYGVGTSMLAEIRALSDGLSLVSAIGYRISIVYSDSQVIAHSIKEDRVVLLTGGVETSSPIGGGCTLLVESLRTAFD
ncbi:hypothetical protein Taro_002419 [Colocasia esculenta]|uniref:RNase H type-1 domain-containing protein n=1 Tax=Colocasia esculenta TaxID=4460 RepID=A0A843TE09_COLES|nr:hypothetical protein [Colocasia esculenta]